MSKIDGRVGHLSIVSIITFRPSTPQGEGGNLEPVRIFNLYLMQIYL